MTLEKNANITDASLEYLNITKSKAFYDFLVNPKCFFGQMVFLFYMLQFYWLLAIAPVQWYQFDEISKEFVCFDK